MTIINKLQSVEQIYNVRMVDEILYATIDGVEFVQLQAQDDSESDHVVAINGIRFIPTANLF